MFQPFVLTIPVPGTLSANVVFRWTVPFDCTLRHVSSSAENDSDATIMIGTSADDNGFLAACVIGDSGVPVEKELADFDGALLTDAGKEYPSLSDGDILLVTIDYDGASGTAAQNLNVALTLAKG